LEKKRIEFREAREKLSACHSIEEEGKDKLLLLISSDLITKLPHPHPRRWLKSSIWIFNE
jgi:hypothetical protein